MADASVVVVPPVNVDELAVGTKVLSLWGKALYTATIIRIRGEAPNRKFKIRYEATRPANGFSHKHDTTVKEADVLKRFGVYMPANGVHAEPAKEPSVASAKRQETPGGLKRKNGTREHWWLPGAPSGSKHTSAAAASNSHWHTSRPAAKRTYAEATATAPHSSLHVTEKQQIKIPLSLLKILVKDRDAINVHGKWTKLPARVTVQQILDEYAKSLETADLENVSAESDMPITREKLRESAVAMRQFFDQALPLRLLYDIEHHQYEMVAEKMKREYMARRIPKKAAMSELYGLPHLLRALVFVDDFLPETNWSQPDVDNMHTQVKHLIGFLGSKVDLGEYLVDDTDFVDGNAAGHSELLD